MIRDELRYWEDRVGEALVDEFDSPDDVDTTAFRCDPTIGCLRWLERVLMEKRAALSAPAWSTSPPTEPGWYWIHDRHGTRCTEVEEGERITGFANNPEKVERAMYADGLDVTAHKYALWMPLTPPPLPTTEDQA